MTRCAPLIALACALASTVALGASCKKQTSRGDLPPATDWQAGTAPAGSNGAATTAPPDPHAGMDNPHAGTDNPHAGTDNPHAGMDNPHAGPVPEQTAPTSLGKLADGRLALGPFSVVPPPDWAAKPVMSRMRVADFVLPGKAGEAELIVYYFGSGGAGSIEENVNRWVDQFQQPDGKASRDVAKIEKTRFGGQEATYVSLNGRYVNQGMPGGGGPVDKPDQALLAAIVGSPSGPYYFKLVGPKQTVDAHTKAFRAMLDSLKLQ
ncbi:MAG TPA: hypothetical protein VHT91_49370 [Kofleriaceae bacterium]|jgi:hypothetical protein|nr:hypothetical protein [Kofleriaceae bacterium]